MAKKSKKPKKKKNRKKQQPGNDELHFLMGGVHPSDEFHQVLNDEFQRRLRESPLFDEMVSNSVWKKLKN